MLVGLSKIGPNSRAITLAFVLAVFASAREPVLRELELMGN